MCKKSRSPFLLCAVMASALSLKGAAPPVFFNAPIQFQGLGNVAGAGDFSGDGKLDLVLVGGIVGAGTVQIRAGNGHGGFEVGEIYNVGGGPNYVAVGDFDNDGKLDLAAANWNSGTVSILLGNGNGTFQAAVDYSAGPGGPHGLTVGDFNGDGRLDLAVATSGGNTVAILLGDGDGTFGPPTAFAVGAYPESVVAADFNGDGKLDLAVSNFGADYYEPGTISILLGNGDGTFQPQATYSTGGLSPTALAVADFNGDGTPDLVVSDITKNDAGYFCEVAILLGNGDGTLQPAVVYPVGTPSSIPAFTGVAAVGDFNHDGKPDLAVGSGSATVSILLGNGDEHFPIQG
jgi:FG-GAP-like repeat